MNYNFKQDLKAIREILELTQVELAEQLGVEQKTISRNEVGQTEPTSKLLEQVYTLITQWIRHRQLNAFWRLRDYCLMKKQR